MKISIITVVLNRREYIYDCMLSVRNQSYKNVEHIILDGESQDGTVDIIKNNLTSNVLFQSKKDLGIYYALNNAILLASGDVVGILHSDDIFASNLILETVAETFKTKNVNSVYGDLVYVNKKNTNKIIRYWKSNIFNLEDLANGWMPPHPTFFINRDILINNLYNTIYKISSDYDLLIRLFKKNEINSYYLPIIITKMRIGGLSNSNLYRILSKSTEDYYIIRRHKIGSLITLFKKNFLKIKQFI